MKIAHISDLHICTEFKRRNIKNTQKLLEYITENNYDHVVITGDVTEDGKTREFKIMRKILEEFNLLNSLKLSMVIGNHDIYGGIQLAEDILKFPGKCAKINYKEKVQEFEQFFSEAFDDVYSPNGELFPFAKDLKKFVLVGINTIDKYSKLKNIFASNGKIFSSQIKGLYDIFNSKKFKDRPVVFALHHHLYKISIQSASDPGRIWTGIENQTMKLRGRKKLINFLNKYKVKLVLHGHVHESFEYYKKGLRCLNGGETFRHGSSSKIRFNSIIFEDENSIKTDITTLPAKKRSDSENTYPGMIAVNFD